MRSKDAQGNTEESPQIAEFVRVLKTLEFQKSDFKALKVLEFRFRSLKVLDFLLNEIEKYLLLGL